MTEQRVIGRVESADIETHGNIVALCVTFKYADKSGQGLVRVLSRKLVKAVLGVFDVERLSQTVGCCCWVEHTPESIVRLEPLFPDEGETLDFRMVDLDDAKIG